MEPGNVNLAKQPRVLNPDGSVSTVRSTSFEDNGQEVLVPEVSPTGQMLSGPMAEALYHMTGKHLGKFMNVPDSNSYAEQLHNDYAAGKYNQGKPKFSVNGSPIEMALGHRKN